MIPVVIYDSIVVICFCVLAYLFGHWWIVLFSYLLILTYKKHTDGDDNKKDGVQDDKMDGGHDA